MAKQTLTVRVSIAGLHGTLDAFRELPRNASQELREASLEIAQDLAGDIRAAALTEGRQAAALASTVKATRDRVPAVTAGGTGGVGRHRTPAWQLLFGAEFGANGRYGWFSAARYRAATNRQFKPHAGTEGYWFFPTARLAEPEMGRRWRAAADEIVRKFGGGA